MKLPHELGRSYKGEKQYWQTNHKGNRGLVPVLFSVMGKGERYFGDIVAVRQNPVNVQFEFPGHGALD